MIRTIQQADREAYLAMAKEFYSSEAVAHSIPEKHILDTFDELMRSDVYAQAYILEKDGETAGYALLAKTFSQEGGGLTVWLEEIYVRPEYRGCGLGREFFAFWKEQYGDFRRFRLEVEPDNARAIALYEQMGFEMLPYQQMILDK